jgi:hypothetical protein
MAKGAGKTSEDWACCEQCSYCFTLFVGILFFLTGGAMAVYAALWLWSDIDVSIAGLELLDVNDIQIAIFIVGMAIALTALLGMISAGCAKCAANPDGKNDCCEKCCTAILSIFYIIILSLLLACTLSIAGILSYYAAVIQTSTHTACPYEGGGSFEAANSVDPLACPLDYLLHEAFYLGVRFCSVFVLRRRLSGWLPRMRCDGVLRRRAGCKSAAGWMVGRVQCGHVSVSSPKRL